MDPLPYQNPNTGNGASLRNGLFANDEALKAAVDAAEAAIGANAEAITGKANTSHTHAANQVSDFAEAVAGNAAVAANTDKRSYPIEDETKLAALPTRAELTAEIEAVEGGPGMDFDAATDLAAAASLAWGTHYTADIAANVTIASFTGTPAEGSRLFWTGRVTAAAAVTFSFPAARRQGASGTATSVQLAPGNRTMMFEFLNGAINLLDTGQTANPATGVQISGSAADLTGGAANADQSLVNLGTRLLAVEEDVAALGSAAVVFASTVPAEPVPGTLYHIDSEEEFRVYRANGIDYVTLAGVEADLAPPTLTSVTIATDGNAVTIVPSRAVSAVTPATAWAGLTFTGSSLGAGVAFVYGSTNGSGHILGTLTGAAAALQDEDISVSYAPVAEHPITASNDVALEAFGPVLATNASTVPPPAAGTWVGNATDPFAASSIWTHDTDGANAAHIVAWKRDLGSPKSGTFSEGEVRGGPFNTSGRELGIHVYSHDSENDRPNALIAKLRSWNEAWSGGPGNITFGELTGALDANQIVWFAIGTETNSQFGSKIAYEAGTSERTLFMLQGSDNASVFVAADIGKLWNSYADVASAVVHTDRVPQIRLLLNET